MFCSARGNTPYVQSEILKSKYIFILKSTDDLNKYRGVQTLSRASQLTLVVGTCPTEFNRWLTSHPWFKNSESGRVEHPKMGVPYWCQFETQQRLLKFINYK